MAFLRKISKCREDSLLVLIFNDFHAFLGHVELTQFLRSLVFPIPILKYDTFASGITVHLDYRRRYKFKTTPARDVILGNMSFSSLVTPVYRLCPPQSGFLPSVMLLGGAPQWISPGEFGYGPSIVRGFDAHF